MGNQRLDHLLSEEQGPSGPEVEAPRAPPLPLLRVFRLPSDEAGPRGPPTGGMAQLVERLLCKQDVAGSNPAASTNPLGL